MPDYNGVVWIITEDDDGFFVDYEVIQDLTQTALDGLELTHFGIKGMKWGVRRDSGSDGRVGSGRVTVKERVGSLKRERDWKKVLGELDQLTTDEIMVVGKRITLENDLKRLVKDSNLATKKDKADYVRRGELDDVELSRKVTRLRAKDNLSKAVSSASKEQREFGEKVVNTSGALALTYATKKTLTPKDIFDAVSNPKPIKDKAVKEIMDKVMSKSSK